MNMNSKNKNPSSLRTWKRPNTSQLTPHHPEHNWDQTSVNYDLSSKHEQDPTPLHCLKHGRDQTVITYHHPKHRGGGDQTPITPHYLVHRKDQTPITSLLITQYTTHLSWPITRKRSYTNYLFPHHQENWKRPYFNHLSLLINKDTKKPGPNHFSPLITWYLDKMSNQSPFAPHDLVHRKDQIKFTSQPLSPDTWKKPYNNHFSHFITRNIEKTKH